MSSREHRFDPWKWRDERAAGRKEYFRDHYRANREQKISAAKARNQADPARYAAYMREYRKRARQEDV